MNMPRVRKSCQGIFRGLVIGRKNQNGGFYAAIKNGECEVIACVERNTRPEFKKLEEEVVDAFIRGDRLPIV
jgi:hypothetical protein